MSSTAPKLLLVEDCSNTLDLLSHVLLSRGYTFETAVDGVDAVTKAASYHPDCAVLNYVMPRMDGLQAAVEIHKILPDCKFVFFTGNYGNPKFHEKLRELGFSENLAIGKPFLIAEFIQLIERTGFPPPLP